jgi:hypothetical protein
MAVAIRQATDLSSVEELAFVGIRPFYGLALYLDRKIESVHFAQPGLEYSKFLAEENLCEELAARERNLFIMKRSRAEPFLATMARCGGLAAIEVGQFQADDNEFLIYVARRISAGR